MTTIADDLHALLTLTRAIAAAPTDTARDELRVARVVAEAELLARCSL